MKRDHLGDCAHCDRRVFLRPVLIFPGMAGPDCAVSVDLCLWCRVNWFDSKWSALVTTFLHHPRREVRETAQWALEWATRVPAVEDDVDAVASW
jgi:hypothetical protein